MKMIAILFFLKFTIRDRLSTKFCTHAQNIISAGRRAEEKEIFQQKNILVMFCACVQNFVDYTSRKNIFFQKNKIKIISENIFREKFSTVSLKKYCECITHVG